METWEKHDRLTDQIPEVCAKSFDALEASELFRDICLWSIDSDKRRDFAERLKNSLWKSTAEFELMHQQIILHYVHDLLESYINQKVIFPEWTWASFQVESGIIHPCSLHKILYGIAYLLEFGTEEQREAFHRKLIHLFHNQNWNASRAILEALSPIIIPSANKALYNSDHGTT